MFVLMARRNSWDIYCHALHARRHMGAGRHPGIAHAPQALGRGDRSAAGPLSGLSKGPVSYYALLLPFIVAMLATGGWQGMRARGPRPRAGAGDRRRAVHHLVRGRLARRAA